MENELQNAYKSYQEWAEFRGLAVKDYAVWLTGWYMKLEQQRDFWRAEYFKLLDESAEADMAAIKPNRLRVWWYRLQSFVGWRVLKLARFEPPF